MAETVSSAELFNYAPKSRFSSFDISLPEGIVPEAMASDIVSGKTDINNFKNNIVSSADLFKSDSVVSSADLFKNTPDKISSPKFEEMPFKGKYPNTYAALKTISDMIPYAEYLDPDERDAFMKLSTQGQTNKLLKNTLDAELMLAFPKLLEGAGNVVAPAMQRFFPKTYKFWTQERGLGKTNIPTDQPIIQPTPTTPEVISSKELFASEPASKVVAEVTPIETAITPEIISTKTLEKLPDQPITPTEIVEPAATSRGKLDIESKYPRVSGTVDGRVVRKGVPNTDSISASLNDYTELKGIREVPMSDFTLTGKHYSVPGNKRIAELASQIKESGEISPLIVVIDKKGSYILEGATRADALYKNGAKSFPAKVVIDNESFAKSPSPLPEAGAKVQTSMDAMSYEKNFLLDNPKTEISKPLSNQVTPKNADMFAEKTPKIETEPLKTDGKPAKAALDINKTIVEKGFDELPPEELARYNPITKKETVQKVSDLITTDKEKAFNMAKGNEPIPNDIHPQVLFNAVKNEATAKGDVQTLMDLAKSPIAEERSIAAQKLGASGFNNVADDVVSKIRDVQKAREATIKSPKIAETVKTKLKAEVNKINLTKDDLSWERFLSKIEC